MTISKKLNVYLILAALLFVPAGLAMASETNGTILSDYNLTRICKNAACDSYGRVNWKPTITGEMTGATVVAITDSGLTGYAWGDEIGWINLAPTGSGLTINSTTGVISGMAYSNVGSWINFAPTGEGVTINSSGEFDGWAWVSGINGGWMKFDCAAAATCIKTDWRPEGSRTAEGDDDQGEDEVSAPVVLSSSGSSSRYFLNSIFSVPGCPGGFICTPVRLATSIQQMLQESYTPADSWTSPGTGSSAGKGTLSVTGKGNQVSSSSPVKQPSQVLASDVPVKPATFVNKVQSYFKNLFKLMISIFRF